MLAEQRRRALLLILVYLCARTSCANGSVSPSYIQPAHISLLEQIIQHSTLENVEGIVQIINKSIIIKEHAESKDLRQAAHFL